MSESADQSHLDLKYFIDPSIYNCPFCNRRHVTYWIEDHFQFNWSKTKKCYAYKVSCGSCRNTSMHLSFTEIHFFNDRTRPYYHFKTGIDIDSQIFYSVPTSFFVLDERIPAVIRELITEAEGCRKMNFLTGASACARKAIYELLVFEKADGEHYEDKIKSLKSRFRNIDPDLFDILGHIQDMTSDKVHEQSWPKWDSPSLTLIVETLKAVLHEVYVVPAEKAERSSKVQQLLEKVRGKKVLGPDGVEAEASEA